MLKELTAEQREKCRLLAAKHRIGELCGAKHFTMVQVTVQVHTAVAFRLPQADVEALTLEEFNELCYQTNQHPYDLLNTGALDVKHDAEFVDPRDHAYEEEA